MAALRSALLLLFVCYCRASEECSCCVDPMVSVPCTRITLLPHFELVRIIILYQALPCTHRISR